MSEIVDRLAPPMNSAIMACWYRVLGLCSLYVPIEESVKFAKADDNPYGGEATKIWELAGWQYWKWESVSVSKQDAEDPIEFTIFLLGDHQNTVFIRNNWYNLHLFGGAILSMLGLKSPPGRMVISRVRESMRNRRMESNQTDGED